MSPDNQAPYNGERAEARWALKLSLPSLFNRLNSKLNQKKKKKLKASLNLNKN